MRELSLFTGAGGGVLASKLLGWTTIGYVEYEPYCQQIIKQRIADGILDAAPIFGDVRAFVSGGHAGAYTGMVDVVTAGFPCQPFSVAGKQQGADDERNMWPATLDVIRAVRPRYAFMENVSGLVASGYFGTILGGLAESGYDCRWRILSAAELGAPHKRDRLWIVAYMRGSGLQGTIGKERQRGRLRSTDERQKSVMGDSQCERGNRGTVHNRNEPKTSPGGPSDTLEPASEGREAMADAAGAGPLPATHGGIHSGEERAGPRDGELERPRQVADTSSIHAQGFHDGPGQEQSRRGSSWWDRDPADVSDSSRGWEGLRWDVRGCGGLPKNKGLEHPPGGASGDGPRERGPTEPDLGRVAHGVADRVDRLKAIGNGQVPAVAALAWKLLTEGMDATP